MELSAATNQQLFDLLSVISKEIRRRKRLKLDLELNLLFEKHNKENPDFSLNISQVYDGGNKNKLLAICPRLLKDDLKKRLHLFGRIMCQSWEHLFLEGDETKKYYVYGHVDPVLPEIPLNKRYGGQIKGTPFYIGKGTGARAYDLKRNQAHGKKIKQLLSEGVKEHEIVHFFQIGLTERQAFEVEAKLIYFFGTIYEGNRKGILVNLDESRRPKFEGYIKTPS